VPTDLFKITGQWGTAPQDGGLLRSGAAPIGPTPISETVTLDQKNLVSYTLNADAVQAVAFGGVVNCHVLVVESDRKVKVRVTSADGAVQSIPCDGFLQIISKSVPFTAIDLTRQPAVLTNVSVFLGEKA
jgi:hypothetical protein